METSDEQSISLSKYLSQAGIASRRNSVKVIHEGRVKVNGITITEPGTKVSNSDEISCDNKAINIGKRYYIMLNKPRGYICTAEDPYAKKRALDLVKIADARLFTAGRLDKDSEGLLIVTNDGEYSAKLTHPRYEILKTYQVKTDGPLTDSDLQAMKNGISDRGETLKVVNVSQTGNCQYQFILNEGKKREIRRLIGYAKRKTVFLKRIAIGRLPLNDLPEGKWRFLSEQEILLSLKNN
jgi:23S rRNA pseudouridine2605 synthase